jgi:hypothetical protein
MVLKVEHWKVDQKYLINVELGCWRRLEKVIWTDHLKNEVLDRGTEKMNILTVKRKNANWFGHIIHVN